MEHEGKVVWVDHPLENRVGLSEPEQPETSDNSESEEEDVDRESSDQEELVIKTEGSVILQTLQQRPKKKKNMAQAEKEEYKKEKREWREKKKEMKKHLSPDEKKEYRREKKELSQQEKNERKKARNERREMLKQKRKPKIGTMVTRQTKSYELVCDMLLGIRVTVSKVAARPLKNTEVKPKDYKVINLKFPRAGSTNGLIPTPAHSQRDFQFRDYAPLVFRRLREHFGIDSADYLISLTGDYLLSELISPGQSGQFFYFSCDLRFMLKTLTRSEARFLKEILPRYYKHIMDNPDSLMTKFFGFHRVSPHRDQKHYFVVMGNIFAQNLEILFRFDLKGSFVGRVTSPEKIKNDPNVVMKDQDFDNMKKSIILGPDKKRLFIEQVTRDVKLLEELKIMDYSLLLGIHDLKRAQKVDRRRSLSMVYLPKTEEEFAATSGFNEDSDLSGSDSEEYKQYHITTFTQDQGGFQSTDDENNPYDEIYFMGIIDILQPYNLRKIAEHSFKSLRYEGDQISAVNPHLYARRFLEFVTERVRVPEGVKGESHGDGSQEEKEKDKKGKAKKKHKRIKSEEISGNAGLVPKQLKVEKRKKKKKGN